MASITPYGLVNVLTPSPLPGPAGEMINDNFKALSDAITSLGFSGFSGVSGMSGLSGRSGFSGISGSSGISGFSGTSGLSGLSGFSGTSGISGVSGASGVSGYSGWSGFSGISGKSGTSGLSGASGYSGWSGLSGYSGFSGNGSSGFSGASGAFGQHAVGTGTAPTIAAGTGAGSSPTISLTGRDLAGQISLTTGSNAASQAANSIMFTVTFNASYTNAPIVLVSPAEVNATNALSSAGWYLGLVNTTSFQILQSGGAVIPNATTLIFNYHVVGI